MTQVKLYKEQTGFGVVEAMLIFIIVGIIGFTGWYVFNAQKNANKSLSLNGTVTPVTKKTTSTNKTATPTTDTDTSTKYMAIKEWGVKIPLSSNDIGAYYTVSKDIEQSASDPTNLIVYAKEVDDLTGPAGVSCKGEYVAYLLRLPTDDPAWQPSTSAGDGKVDPTYQYRTVVGNYTYTIATKKQYGPECFETSKTGDYKADEQTINEFTDVVSAFTSDFQKIAAE